MKSIFHIIFLSFHIIFSSIRPIRQLSINKKPV